MYRQTSLQQLYAQLELAIGDNLQGSGFGQFRLALQPNCGNASHIRLENTVHQGFELNGPDVQMLLGNCFSASEVDPAFLPIWQPLHHKLEAILAQGGHGSLVVSFKRTRNNRWAVVTVEGGVSHLVRLPIDPNWL